MRVVHYDIVDMAYAASAPMKFYDQTVGVNDYYDHITDVAEKSSPGCADKVRTTLSAVAVEIQKAGDDRLSFCGNEDGYMQTHYTILHEYRPNVS